MKVIFAVAVLAAIGGLYFASQTSTSSDVEEKFQNFFATYRKSYLNAETYSQRLAVFGENLNEISRLNAENPAATYGVTEFADQTLEERMSILGWKAPSTRKFYRNTPGTPKTNDVNWVDESETTAVKDQKSCGSCWAFSATETLESVYAIHNNLKGSEIPQLSEQQSVDCVKAPEYGSEGCSGGWMDDTFDYAVNNKMCLETEYAYTARDGTCQDTKCTLDLQATGRVNIPEGDVNALLEAAEHFPVAIAVDASDWSFYMAGIHKSSKTSLNHGVQLDGYHINSNNGDYMLVRNSWGGRWGMKGFIMLDITKNSGAALSASYPTFEGQTLPGLAQCQSGEDPDAAKNCLCSYGDSCSADTPCKDECGCGEF
jgi:C1A family cysteine protease